MARAKILSNIEERLNELIQLDQEQKDLTKKVKELKAEIAGYMRKNNLTELTPDGGSIKIIKVRSESFNEEKLIPYLHENGIEAIYLAEHVDYDKLNQIAYDNMDLVKDLTEFKETKETERMIIHAN